MGFESLKVTAHLRTGVVSDRWIPLDGILWYQLHRDVLGTQDITTPGGSVETLPREQMPLEIINPDSAQWFYSCSWAQPQPWWAQEGCDYWNKRFDSRFADLVDFGGKRGKVIIEQGKYKAYHMPVFYLAALQIEWYCVGDGESITRLLSTCTHIGKKASQGWGRVSCWIVERFENDYSMMRGGMLTRGVPKSDIVGNMMFYGVRPSYYNRNNQFMLVMP